MPASRSWWNLSGLCQEWTFTSFNASLLRLNITIFSYTCWCFGPEQENPIISEIYF